MSTELLRPNAAGDVTALIATGAAQGFQCVDEAVSDDDTTYVSYPDSNNYDLYNLPSPSSIQDGDTINSVTIYSTARKVTGGQFKLCLKENATTTFDTAKELTASYAEYSTTWNTRPSDNGAWTYDDIVALQIGVQTIGVPVRTARMTQVWVVVDYTTAGAGASFIHKLRPNKLW